MQRRTDSNCKANNTMKEKTLESWEDFERELVAIDEKTKVLRRKVGHHMEHPLYRGVSDSKYHLESTLDRIRKEMSFSEYRRIMKRVNKHVATCTGKKWKLVENVDHVEAERCKVIKLRDIKLPIPNYEFMAYLRHNGFPSPLVDWTESPYIAAFFAFRNVSSKAKDVSIFVHMGQFFYGQDPCICILGPTIVTDHKHYLQQSQYSICYREINGEIYYANHEDAKEYVEEQTILTKYTIPISEREKVLRKIDSMNITAYSLFGSESSLMETLAIREISFEKWDCLLASQNE